MAIDKNKQRKKVQASNYRPNFAEYTLKREK